MILTSFTHDPRRDLIRFAVTPEIEARLAEPFNLLTARLVFKAIEKEMPVGFRKTLSRRKVMPCLRRPPNEDGTRVAPVLGTMQSILGADRKNVRDQANYQRQKLVASEGVE